jgi:hypothetical protein
MNSKIIKYMLLYRQKNAVKMVMKNVANRSSENVSHFKYFGTTVTNPNLI